MKSSQAIGHVNYLKSADLSDHLEIGGNIQVDFQKKL
jgi:hypothetical protein